MDVSRRLAPRVIAQCLAAGVALLVLAGLTVSTPQAGNKVSQVAEISGPPSVIDGDTIDIAGERIRLEGIDAPELAQTCALGAGKVWRAGRAAKRALERLTRGRHLRCQVFHRDGYGRHVAQCMADGKNINQLMVLNGHAWAFLKYSKRFAAQERDARQRKIGVWAARCVRAVAYRQGNWLDQSARAPAGCPIKGNISRRGRIYHMPWDRWYGRTKVEKDRGERWFCSEAEAQAAGWRPALG